MRSSNSQLPQLGDVVVRTVGSRTSAYELCPTPAPAQIKCRTYAAALAVARRWATLRHVDVWFVTEERIFAPLSRHRSGR